MNQHSSPVRSNETFRHRLSVVACVALALVLFTASSASACPSCKAAIANNQGQGDLVSGFFYSILFMLSMPFAIIGSFSSYMYVLVRRAREEQARAPRDQSPADEPQQPNSP